LDEKCILANLFQNLSSIVKTLGFMMNKYNPAFRSLKLRFLPLALGLVFWTQQAASQNNLIVTGAQTITGNATYDNVTVQSGGVLTVNGILIVNLDMTVENGGLVTHSPRFEAGLQLDVAGTLTIPINSLLPALYFHKQILLK
jgi:hypothetical protein